MKTTYTQAIENLINTLLSNATDTQKEKQYETFCKCYPYFDTSKIDNYLQAVEDSNEIATFYYKTLLGLK
jgi:hypothetical protein